MAETEEVTEAAEHEGTDDERLTRVENALADIRDMLAGLKPDHAAAQRHEADKLDRPSSVAEQVAAIMDKRDRDAAAKQAADAERADAESVKERLARLEEKPPAPQRSPLAKFVTAGWGDGRA